MMENSLYIAAAGSGKTTFLVNHAYDLINNIADDKVILIITFTQKNQQEIEQRFIKRTGVVPHGVKICGWYNFLLEYLIRPFAGTVIENLRCQNTGVLLVEGISGTSKYNGKYYKLYKNGDLQTKFLNESKKIFSDKISEFAYTCYKKNKVSTKERLSNICHSVLIDEVQDLSAWDYCIVKILIDIHNIHVVMCGDPRQRTYTTTQSPKWSKYKGRIDEFVKNEVNKSHCKIHVDYTTLGGSHRFGDKIANFASRIIGDEYPPTKVCKCNICSERQIMYSYTSGVYLLRHCMLDNFIHHYNPLVLIWDKRFDEGFGCRTLTYGNAKGLTTDVSLIIPTKNIISNFLSSQSNSLNNITRSKLYVAATRARFIAAILVDDDFDNLIGLPYFNFPKM